MNVQKNMYRLDKETGRLVRIAAGTSDEVFIGTLNGDVIEWESKTYQKNYTPVVFRQLKSMGINVLRGVVKEGAVEPAPELPQALTNVLGVSAEEPATETANIAPATASVAVGTFAQPVDPYAGLTVAQRKAVIYLRQREGLDPFNVEKPTTKMPVNQFIAHKAPEVVNWLLRYDPIRFCKTYRVIGIGVVTVSEMGKDDKGNVIRNEKAVRSVLSLAKNHLTERAESPDVEVED